MAPQQREARPKVRYVFRILIVFEYSGAKILFFQLPCNDIFQNINDTNPKYALLYIKSATYNHRITL